MFARLPLEVSPVCRVEIAFGSFPSIPLWLRGVSNDSLQRLPLETSPCNSTVSTLTFLNRDMVEMHLTSQDWHEGSMAAANQLLQWLELLRIPWAIGKTAKTLEKRMRSLMKDFCKLQKNVNARVNRGGNKTAAAALTEFLNAPFDKLKVPKSCPVTPPPVPPPAPDETCPQRPSSSCDESQLSMDVYNPPVPPQSCPVTPPPVPPPAPDETCPQRPSSSCDESQLSMDVSNPPDSPAASPIAIQNSISATPVRSYHPRGVVDPPLTSTPEPNRICTTSEMSPCLDQALSSTLGMSSNQSVNFVFSPLPATPPLGIATPTRGMMRTPMANVSNMMNNDIGTPTSAVLRSGKQISPPSVAELEKKLHRSSRSVDKLTKENTLLKSMVGVRYRDLANDFETEINATKTEMTKALRHSESRLNVTLKVNEQLRKENECVKLVCTELMDMADEKEEEANKAAKQASKMTQHVRKVAKEKHNLQKKVKHKDDKIEKLLESFETDKQITEHLHERIVNEPKQQNEDLTTRMQKLQTLDARKGRRYSAEIRLVYYDLLTKGVSCNVIESVVRRVLETLSDKDVKRTKLPSQTTAQRMKVEAGYMVKLRLAWEWKQHASKEAVFHSDKTTKGQIEWLSIVLKLAPSGGEERTFTLCLEPVSSGTSESTLGTFQKCLDELCDIAVKNNLATMEEGKSTYSFKNIVGQMSDRAATETKVTRLLVEEKARQLQEDGLAAEELEERAKVYNFTCSLHKINNTAVAMTSAAEKHLKFDANDISGTRHIYQTDKLICTESNKEYAQGTRFRSFCLSEDCLEESGSTLFKPIVGGRYLVYCENAIPTFNSKDLIMLFLQDLKETKKLNKLEQGVYDGFLSSKVMAEVRALALIYHDLLQPMYAKALKAKNPLELNDDYNFTVEKMELFAVHPSGLLQGTDPCIKQRHPDTCKTDRYIERVRETDETDDLVLTLLKVMCAAGAEKLRSHAKEHLPGGDYFANEDPHLRRASDIIGDSTNNVVESRFASVDREMVRCRRSNPLSVGGNVASKHDHVVDFLEYQDDDIREDLCMAAMKGGREMMATKGTKNQQLKRLYEESKPERKAKKQKLRERRRKAEEKKQATHDALRRGDVIQKPEELDACNVAQLKQQCQLWNQLTSYIDVNRSDLLKGYYKKSKPLLLDLLKTVVSANRSVNTRKVHVNDSESDSDLDHEDVESSSDEDDLVLADLVPLSKSRRH